VQGKADFAFNLYGQAVHRLYTRWKPDCIGRWGPDFTGGKYPSHDGQLVLAPLPIYRDYTVVAVIVVIVPLTATQYSRNMRALPTFALIGKQLSFVLSAELQQDCFTKLGITADGQLSHSQASYHLVPLPWLDRAFARLKACTKLAHPGMVLYFEKAYIAQ
jgi:hypothetical protein